MEIEADDKRQEELYHEVAQLYQKAAELGNAYAQYKTGCAFFEGCGVVQNKTAAVKWWRKAVTQGHDGALKALGQTGGAPAVDSESDAAKALRKKAEEGNPEAQYRLGTALMCGDGVLQDRAEAVMWYQKAAEQGNAKAQFQYGVLLYDGDGVVKDMAEGMQWLRKAAGQGIVEAQFNLSIALGEDGGNEANKAEALMWTRRAAEQGLARAQYDLAVALDRGEGLPENQKESVAWYRKAAEQGMVQAQYCLASALRRGVGVAEDKAEAVAWYRKAAEQGYADAQCNLGVALYNGEGAAKDAKEGLKWLQAAADQGHFDAKANLEYVSRKSASADDHSYVCNFREKYNVAVEWVDNNIRGECAAHLKEGLAKNLELNNVVRFGIGAGLTGSDSTYLRVAPDSVQIVKMRSSELAFMQDLGELDVRSGVHAFDAPPAQSEEQAWRYEFGQIVFQYIDNNGILFLRYDVEFKNIMPGRDLPNDPSAVCLAISRQILDYTISKYIRLEKYEPIQRLSGEFELLPDDLGILSFKGDVPLSFQIKMGKQPDVELSRLIHKNIKI